MVKSRMENENAKAAECGVPLVNECYLFGGLLMDYYYSIDAWPKRSQDGFITGESAMVGGCSVNMAATIKNLGMTAHVISGIGNDTTAGELSEYMKKNGLSDKLLETVQGISGKCLVFLEPDGERTFLTGKGAEGIFSESLDRLVRSEIPAAAGVTGYYLLDKDAHRVMDCIEYLHSKGTQVLFDPSPLVSSIDDGLLRRIIKVSSVITPNTAELEVIQKFTSVEDYCAEGKTMVVKSGSKGGTVYTGVESFGAQQSCCVCDLTVGGGEKAQISGNQQSDTDGKCNCEVASFNYDAELCEAVDTTGAGDSFSGALLYSMMQGTDVRGAVALASKCAGITVQIEGPHGFWKLEEF